MRGPERNALIPAFGAVVASHPRKERSFFFQLSFFEGPKLQKWDILKPVERFEFGFERTTIGVSSPYGIVPLSAASVDDDDGHFGSLTKSEYPPLPRESECITTWVDLELPIDFLLSFHSLREVKMPNLELRMKRDPQFSLNAPLLHTLKVLDVMSISSPYFAGQTFHMLERFRETLIQHRDIPEQGPLIEMPVCTRLDVSLFRLATLKLPQIRELGLTIHAEHDHIWETHIAASANLSGLKLLYLQYSDGSLPTIPVIKILGSLPALETLITFIPNSTTPHIHFFEAFVPMNVPGRSALNQSCWKGQIAGVLCPRLESLQIECISPTEQAELIPVLKDIVTLRAIIGSPLKSFTFCFHERHTGIPWKLQLIGRDKSFMMEEVVPDEWFRLDI